MKYDSVNELMMTGRLPKVGGSGAVGEARAASVLTSSRVRLQPGLRRVDNTINNDSAGESLCCIYV